MLSVLIWIEETVGRVLLAAIVVLVFVAAITRTFDHPLIWSVDLAQALFVWLCFAGAVKALRIRAHIGVDYFVKRLPDRACAASSTSRSPSSSSPSSPP